MLRPKLTGAALAAVAVLGGGGFAFAHLALGVPAPVPPEKGDALARLAAVGTTDSSSQPASAPELEPVPIPAEMLGPDVPAPVAPSLLRRRNGWLVSDGKHLVAVYAGAPGGEPSMGRVVIVRQDLVAGKQTIRALDAGPTGALEISGAPLGASVETSAQRTSLRLRTTGGGLLVLDLGTGSIRSLSNGQLR